MRALRWVAGKASISSSTAMVLTRVASSRYCVVAMVYAA